jgi:hypothetical protein
MQFYLQVYGALRVAADIHAVSTHPGVVFDTYVVPAGSMKVGYNLQFGQACVDAEYNCPTENIKVTIDVSWSLPSSPKQLYDMYVNFIPGTCCTHECECAYER